MVAIHQFVPTLAPRDALGGHYMRMRATLRAAGYTSDIYAMNAIGELSKEARPFDSFSGGRAGLECHAGLHGFTMVRVRNPDHGAAGKAGGDSSKGAAR